MSRGNDLTGEIFGRLKVVAEINPKGLRIYGRRWLCLCECGEHTAVSAGNLRKTNKAVKSCGCLATDKRRLRPYEAVYNRLLRIAKKVLVQALSYEEFLHVIQTKTCHYCGAELHWTKHFSTNRGSSSYNLDRKDSSLSYSVNNLVTCCTLCNFTKANRFTYQQMLKLGEVIRTFQ